MSSKYSSEIPLLVREIHNLLIKELDLPTTFKSVDPELEEKYGLLSTQSLTDGDMQMLNLECLFMASAAFATYWETFSWAIATAVNLDALLPQVQQKVNKRGILLGFERTSNITTGQPRAPIKATQSQRSTIWVVDVMMPCVVKLAIIKDSVCGHL